MGNMMKLYLRKEYAKSTLELPGQVHAFRFKFR